MGQGYMFTCSCCGHEYEVSPGTGMMYPETYRTLIRHIRSGRYGEERRQLFEKTPYAAVNAEEFVYICGSCGWWEEAYDAAIYAPNDPDSLRKTKIGEKTVEEWGMVPYATEGDLRESYHAVKRHYHTCPGCGRRMYKASDKEMRSLSCPRCGQTNTIQDMIMWD